MSDNGTPVSRRQLGALASGFLIATALGGSACGTTRTRTAGQSGAEGDPFALLVAEHRQVDQLLERAAASNDPGERAELLAQVRRALTEHAVAEENALYPVVFQQANLRETVPDLYEEHSQMKVALFQLEQMPKEGETWTKGVIEFRTLIAEHVSEEESVVFPRLKSALGPEQIEQLDQLLRRERGLVG